jgi:small subunit ribosomal protein S4e
MPHLKRYSIPGFWPLAKKGKTFAVKPMPGPHPRWNCIPLRIIVRDILRCAEDSGEAKRILSGGKILVDRKSRKDPKFPVGLMDVIEIPDAKQYFRMGVSSRGLSLHEIKEKDAGKKLCRINRKTTLRGGLQQLNLHDGRNVLVRKDVYRVGDSVTISIPDQKILRHHKFEKGSRAMIVAGRNVGLKGKIVDIRERKNMLEKATVVLETPGGRIQTLREYILIGEI